MSSTCNFVIVIPYTRKFSHCYKFHKNGNFNYLTKIFSRMIPAGNIKGVAWQQFHELLILQLSKSRKIHNNKET